jgi:hypothetical protein
MKAIAIKHNVKCKIMWISPTYAKELLKKNNKKQRRVVERKLAEYTLSVKKEEWELNGETIKIAENGDVLDGQKRLLAAIAANKGFWTVVVTGLKNKVFGTIDCGQSRAGKDMCEMAGLTCGVNKSAIIRFLLYFEKGQFSAILNSGKASYYVTNKETEAFIEKNKEVLEEAYKNGVYYHSKFPKLTITRFSSLWYLLSRISAKAADEFFEMLITGHNLSPKNPVGQLRNQLIREGKAKGKERVEKIAIFLKAWNLYRDKKRVELLTWSSKREKFPKPY